MVGHFIWTLTHHQDSLFDKFLHVIQQSAYRLFIRVGGFLNNVAESTKWSYNVSYCYYDLLKVLVLINQSIFGRPTLSSSIDMAKSSSFLTWSALSVTGFSFNTLECSSLSRRYGSKCLFVKESIDFDILYLYHPSSAQVSLSIFWSLVHCQMNHCLMLYW